MIENRLVTNTRAAPGSALLAALPGAFGTNLSAACIEVGEMVF